MYKWSFVFIVALAALEIQQNEAFIIVSKSFSAAPAPAAAVPAINTNALIQGFNSAVSAKIQALSQAVNSVVQAKLNFKNSLIRSLSTVSAAPPQPTYITKSVGIPVFVKTVSFGPAAAPAAPAATTTVSAGAVATTTSGQSAGYAYRNRQRF